MTNPYCFDDDKLKEKRENFRFDLRIDLLNQQFSKRRIVAMNHADDDTLEISRVRDSLLQQMSDNFLHNVDNTDSPQAKKNFYTLQPFQSFTIRYLENQYLLCLHLYTFVADQVSEELMNKAFDIHIQSAIAKQQDFMKAKDEDANNIGLINSYKAHIQILDDLVFMYDECSSINDIKSFYTQAHKDQLAEFQDLERQIPEADFSSYHNLKVSSYKSLTLVSAYQYILEFIDYFLSLNPYDHPLEHTLKYIHDARLFNTSNLELIRNQREVTRNNMDAMALICKNFQLITDFADASAFVYPFKIDSEPLRQKIVAMLQLNNIHVPEFYKNKSYNNLANLTDFSLKSYKEHHIPISLGLLVHDSTTQIIPNIVSSGNQLDIQEELLNQSSQLQNLTELLQAEDDLKNLSSSIRNKPDYTFSERVCKFYKSDHIKLSGHVRYFLLELVKKKLNGFSIDLNIFDQYGIISNDSDIGKLFGIDPVSQLTHSQVYFQAYVDDNKQQIQTFPDNYVIDAVQEQQIENVIPISAGQNSSQHVEEEEDIIYTPQITINKDPPQQLGAVNLDSIDNLNDIANFILNSDSVQDLTRYYLKIVQKFDDISKTEISKLYIDKLTDLSKAQQPQGQAQGGKDFSNLKSRQIQNQYNQLTNEMKNFKEFQQDFLLNQDNNKLPGTPAKQNMIEDKILNYKMYRNDNKYPRRWQDNPPSNGNYFEQYIQQNHGQKQQRDQLHQQQNNQFQNRSNSNRFKNINSQYSQNKKRQNNQQKKPFKKQQRSQSRDKAILSRSSSKSRSFIRKSNQSQKGQFKPRQNNQSRARKPSSKKKQIRFAPSKPSRSKSNHGQFNRQQRSSNKKKLVLNNKNKQSNQFKNNDLGLLQQMIDNQSQQSSIMCKYKSNCVDRQCQFGHFKSDETVILDLLDNKNHKYLSCITQSINKQFSTKDPNQIKIMQTQVIKNSIKVTFNKKDLTDFKEQFPENLNDQSKIYTIKLPDKEIKVGFSYKWIKNDFEKQDLKSFSDREMIGIKVLKTIHNDVLINNNKVLDNEFQIIILKILAGLAPVIPGFQNHELDIAKKVQQIHFYKFVYNDVVQKHKGFGQTFYITYFDSYLNRKINRYIHRSDDFNGIAQLIEDFKKMINAYPKVAKLKSQGAYSNFSLVKLTKSYIQDPINLNLPDIPLVQISDEIEDKDRIQSRLLVNDFFLKEKKDFIEDISLKARNQSVGVKSRTEINMRSIYELSDLIKKPPLYVSNIINYTLNFLKLVGINPYAGYQNHFSTLIYKTSQYLLQLNYKDLDKSYIIHDILALYNTYVNCIFYKNGIQQFSKNLDEWITKTITKCPSNRDSNSHNLGLQGYIAMTELQQFFDHSSVSMDIEE